jgi:hypothetical protein
MGQLDNLLKSFDDRINVLTNPKPEDVDIIFQQFMGNVVRNIYEMDLDASGSLASSLEALPIETTNGVMKFRVKINDYWRDVDEGTKPKGATKENIAKMLPQIMKWIDNKPSVQQLSKVKKRETLAYLITRAILKKGTIKRFGYKGSKFLSSELPGFKENILKVLEQQLVK